MWCEGTIARRTDFRARVWRLDWPRTGARAVVAAVAVAVVLAERAGVGAAEGVAAGDAVARAVAVAEALVAGRPCSVAEPHAARARAPEVRTAASAAVARKWDA